MSGFQEFDWEYVVNTNEMNEIILWDIGIFLYPTLVVVMRIHAHVKTY